MIQLNSIAPVPAASMASTAVLAFCRNSSSSWQPTVKLIEQSLGEIGNPKSSHLKGRGLTSTGRQAVAKSCSRKTGSRLPTIVLSQRRQTTQIVDNIGSTSASEAWTNLSQIFEEERANPSNSR